MLISYAAAIRSCPFWTLSVHSHLASSHKAQLNMLKGASSNQITTEELLCRENVSNVLCALRDAVFCANKLPSRDQLQFLRATSKRIRRDGDLLSKDIVNLITKISSRYAVTLGECESSDSSSSGSLLSLAVEESVYDKTAETTEESIDYFNRALDDARGIQNADVPISGSLGPDVAKKLGLLKPTRKQPAHSNIKKPQVHFPDYPIDNSDAPFVPPNQTSEMAASANNGVSAIKDKLVDNYSTDLHKSNSFTENTIPHPYEDEIAAAIDQMSQRSFDPSEITVYKSLDDTPFTFITTKNELFDAAERIKLSSEIAVDIENHSVRSFQGFTCLIQISTRREDFVIDALSLRGYIHRALASIFADEATVKVLHGANYDIKWLERDFGIYVVNMFDTGQAARLLKFQSASLSYLLIKYCSVESKFKKKYQLADWRVRPLPEEMLAYARDDTHYLLYVYDRLRDELSKAGGLAKAWKRSGDLCRNRHTKIRYDPGMARDLAARDGLGFDKHQMRLLEELNKWRDSTARKEDESLMFVAPTNVLVGIARAKEKARSVEGFLKHGFPGGTVPPIIQEHAEELVQLICDVLDLNLDDPSTHKNETANSDRQHVQENNAEHLEKAQSDLVVSSLSKATSPQILSKTKPSWPLPNNYSQNLNSTVHSTVISLKSQKEVEKAKPVLRKRKSTLLGSDSESSSEDDSAAQMEGEGVSLLGAKVSDVSEATTNEHESRDMDTTKNASKSISWQTNSQIIDDGSYRQETVCRIQKELSEGVRTRVETGISFQTEINTEIDNNAGSPLNESSMNNLSNADTTVDEEKPIMSILERYGGGVKLLPKGKRDPSPSVTADPTGIKPFDYAQEMLNETMREKDDKNDQIDPMQRLKPNCIKDKKMRVKKRKRGRGKSMTF